MHYNTKCSKLHTVYNLSMYPNPWQHGTCKKEKPMPSINSAAVELFKQKAQPVSIKVLEVPDLKGAMTYAVDVCAAKEFCEQLIPPSGEIVRATVKTLAAPALDDTAYAQLEELADGKDFTMLRSGMRDHLAGIDVAFTLSRKGIAETATCILESLSEELRLATMVCETHVIAIKKSDIVETSYDAEEYLHGLMESGTAYTAFISGPSRTADIERVLTIGVHGPLELHVALMEG